MSAVNVKALARENVRRFLNSFDDVLTDCDGECGMMYAGTADTTLILHVSLSGVLWVQMTPLPHSADVMNLFRRLGKRVFYVTNNSTKTRDDLVDKCRALKFEAAKDDILCTAHLSACYLQSLDFCKKVYVIGSEGKAPSMNHRIMKCILHNYCISTFFYLQRLRKSCSMLVSRTTE